MLTEDDVSIVFFSNIFSLYLIFIKNFFKLIFRIFNITLKYSNYILKLKHVRNTQNVSKLTKRVENIIILDLKNFYLNIS